MVLVKGYIMVGSELRGEKRSGLKPLLAAPQSRVHVRSQGALQKERAPVKIKCKEH
jgi:hypothetical protein